MSFSRDGRIATLRNILSISLVLTSALCASDTPQKEEPALSPKEQEIYIPKDLDDCFRELDKMLDSDDIEKIRKGEIQAIDMHFGLGMGLRNGWGLWADSRLAKYFRKMGITHPDDMSGIILESYVRHLRKEPLRLDEQIAFYKKYWDEMKKLEEAEKKAAEKKKK